MTARGGGEYNTAKQIDREQSAIKRCMCEREREIDWKRWRNKLIKSCVGVEKMRLSEERSREWRNQYVYASGEQERERKRWGGREMVCHLWILPTFCHHLSQGLMMAPDHVISPHDPPHLLKSEPERLNTLASKAKTRGRMWVCRKHTWIFRATWTGQMFCTVETTAFEAEKQIHWWWS